MASSSVGMCSETPPIPNKNLIWDYFTKSIDGKTAVCKTCSVTIKCGHGSTTGPRRHLERAHMSVHQKLYRAEKAQKNKKSRVSSTFSRSDNPIQNRVSTLDAFVKSKETYGQNHPKNNAVRKSVAKWIVEGLHPFSIVDEPGFKEIFKIADEKIVLPHSTTVSRQMLPELYEKTVKSMKEYLNSQDFSSISVTTDMWTSETTASFLAVTIHFVNNDFELISMCLGCVNVKESHTGINIAQQLKAVLNEWNILVTEKPFYCVTDNATNMRSAIANTQMVHLMCFAHTLNLALKDAKKNCPGFDTLLAKCRSIVGHFRHSANAKSQLHKREEQLGYSKLELVQDVETRWNSEYLMLKRLLAIKEPLCLELSQPDCSVDHLTASDWGMIEGYVVMLKPMYETTVEISSEKQPSRSLVIPLLNGLFQGLQQYLLSKGQGMMLARSLLKSLQTRFPLFDENPLDQLCMVLDPRFKDRVLADHLKQSVKTKLAMEMTDNRSQNPAETSPVSSDSNSKMVASVWSAFLKVSKKTTQASSSYQNSKGQVQVEAYFSEPCIDIKGNPLKWWHENGYKYPLLAQLAKKYLGIPATEVSSERVFSSAGNVLTSKRQRLLPEHTEKLVFLHQNKKYIA